jgi:hypothetical protein
MWLLVVWMLLTMIPPTVPGPGFGDPDGCPVRYKDARFPGDKCSVNNWGHSSERDKGRGTRP